MNDDVYFRFGRWTRECLYRYCNVLLNNQPSLIYMIQQSKK